MDTEDRIKELRKFKSLSQKDFGEFIQLSLMNVSDIERGKVKPSIDVIRKISKSFRVSPTWLLTGEGEMFLPSPEEQKAAEKPSLGYLEEVFVSQEDLGNKADKVETQALRRELEHTQERVEALREIVYREHGIKEEPEEIREVLIPYLGFGGAAGPLRELDTIEDQIAVREDFLPPNREKVFAVRIEGGSMADIIPDGSNVLLRVCQEPISGRVYVFTLKGKATIKKFRLDHTGPHFEYMDGSGRSIYPSKGEQWYCNAEFLRVL